MYSEFSSRTGSLSLFLAGISPLFFSKRDRQVSLISWRFLLTEEQGNKRSEEEYITASSS